MPQQPMQGPKSFTTTLRNTVFTTPNFCHQIRATSCTPSAVLLTAVRSNCLRQSFNLADAGQH